MLQADFTGVETGFAPLPVGRYTCKIVNGEIKKSKASLEYVNWELTVVEGEYSERKLFHMTSLAPKALFGLLDMMIACGYIKQEGKGKARVLKTEDGQMYTGKFEPSDLYGRDVIAQVKVDEEYNNNKIVKLLPLV